MSQTATTLRQVLALADLPGWRPSGQWIRARCPIHGSDHQRSLSVRNDDSEYRGFGDCKACGAQVLIRELNPDAAARFESGRAGAGRERSAQQYRQQLARAQLAPRSTAQPEPQEWQWAELAALLKFSARMAARLSDPRPASYLAERGIPLDIAADIGIGYIPADARLAGTGLAAKWRDRLLFPLGSPDGAGFIGRSLHGWTPGMDEDAHKQLLDAKGRDADNLKAWGHRWEKTMPAGWFGYDGLALREVVVIVEGAFDALALIAAGLTGGEVIALAGVAADANWIPGNVRGILLALDGDESGQAKALDLAARLAHAYPWPQVGICTPPADGLGKDWSERWRRAEWDGVATVFDALGDLELSTATPPVEDAVPVAPRAAIRADMAAGIPVESPAEVLPPSPPALVVPDVAAAPVLDDLESEARADPLVSTLLGMGYTLADVREIPEGEPFPPPPAGPAPGLDVPPSEPHACGKRLWARRRDGCGWCCFDCEHAAAVA